MERHTDKPGGRALGPRVGDVDAAMAKIYEDALAEQTFGTEHSLRAAERVGNNRKNCLIDGHIADTQGVDSNGRYGGKSRDAAQDDRRRTIRRDAERQRDQGGDCAVACTGIEYQTKG